MNTKEWLSQHGYDAVLRKIHKVEAGWKRKGTGTRRDWAEVLAGHQDGTPRTVEGIKFPVLCAARKRQGWVITKDCVANKPGEEMPSAKAQARWEKCKAHSHQLEATRES